MKAFILFRLLYMAAPPSGNHTRQAKDGTRTGKCMSVALQRKALPRRILNFHCGETGMVMEHHSQSLQNKTRDPLIRMVRNEPLKPIHYGR